MRSSQYHFRNCASGSLNDMRPRFLSVFWWLIFLPFFAVYIIMQLVFSQTLNVFSISHNNSILIMF